MISPLVSCLMVTRDRAELARRAVHCFGTQTWANKELVIVDDGDVDYSAMLQPFVDGGQRIRYFRFLHEEGVLLGELRNRSIALADGEWCMQWDDDEWYHPNRISVQMAARSECAGVALRWTLAHVQSVERGTLAFRADAGIATPGTILHRRDTASYPNVARGEDSVFLRGVRARGGLRVLGREQSHLFIRSFHGRNTWDENHFLRRLRRRPGDWPSYIAARVRGDLRRHHAFGLTPDEERSIAAFELTLARHRSGVETP